MFLIIGALLAGGAAQASTYDCTSSFLNYNFSMTGTLVGNKAVGSAVVVVTKNGNPIRRGALPVVASQFAPTQALMIDAADDDTKISLNSEFQNGAYVGPMNVESDEGKVNLTTTCRVL